MTDILFLEKDGTLGRFRNGQSGLYHGVADFLQDQKEKERKLCVVTTATYSGITDLTSLVIKCPLDQYFGKEVIGTERGELYITPEGEITRNCNGTDIQKYENPYHSKRHGKDLYLARRLIAPRDYETLRTVMVGDYGDETTPLSDPETPLIIISNRVRRGDWDLVDRLTDQLFSDEAQFPWQVFDRMYQETQQQGNQRIIEVAGVHYVIRNTIELNRGKSTVRIIECPR